MDDRVLRRPEAISVAVISACYLASVASLLVVHTRPLIFSSAFTSVSAVTLIQFVHSMPRLLSRFSRIGYLPLVCQAALCVMVSIACPRIWTAAPGFVAGSLLLLFSRRWAWWTFVASVVVTSALMFRSGGTCDSAPYAVLLNPLIGVVLYALARMSMLMAEVYQSQRQAVTQEQHRFARDLHDLLGYSLTTISLKTKLASRLLPTDVTQAQHELSDIFTVTQQAVTDVREVVHRYRNMSLASEVAAAESLLASIGIRAKIRINTGPMPATTETVLATVLREGLANMLRHSSASQCVIAARHDDNVIEFTMSNDRVGGTTWARNIQGGTGLRSLAARVEALGGQLYAATDAQGWFHLKALVPARDAAQAANVTV